MIKVLLLIIVLLMFCQAFPKAAAAIDSPATGVGFLIGGLWIALRSVRGR